jgi:hypothetical protein
MAAARPPEETAAILALSGSSLYDHFVAEVVRREEAWGLAAAGWAVVSNHDGTSALALWPGAEYAALCATEAWGGHSPLAISLRSLLHQLLPALEDEGLWVLVFPTPSAHGVLVNAEALATELMQAHDGRG